MSIRLKKRIMFIILTIIFIVFIAFNLIINPAGWLLSFFIIGIYEGLINGTIFVKIISTIVFLFLFTAMFELIKVFTNLIFKE